MEQARTGGMSAPGARLSSFEEFAAMISTRTLALSGGLMVTALLAACHGTAQTSDADTSAVMESPIPPAAPADASASDVTADTPSPANTRPGITVSGARLVLPVIAGRPGVLYFTIHNDSPSNATVVAIQLQGASNVQMHRTVGGTMAEVGKLSVMPGGTLDFTPGGLHAMAFGLAKGLAAGGTTQMTLSFANGDRIAQPVPIEAMGSGGAPADTQPANSTKGMDDMPGMQH